MKKFKRHKSFSSKYLLPVVAVMFVVCCFALPSGAKNGKPNGTMELAAKGSKEKHSAATLPKGYESGVLYGSDTEDGRKADAIFMEAQKQSTLDNMDAYFELLQAAYELDTTETYTGQTLGFYLMNLARTDSLMARRGYDLIARRFNQHPDDYYGAILYGMVNSQLGNVDESIRVWTIVDSLNPTKPDVAMKLVEALGQKGDTAALLRSLDVLRRVEKAQGKSIGLSSNIMHAQMELGDTAGTLSELRSLLASSPGNSNYSVYAGDIFLALSRPDSAIVYYNIACAEDSANGLAYYKRAQYYLSQGDSASYDREVAQALRQESLDYAPKMEMLRDFVRRNLNDSLRGPQIRSLFDDLLEMYPHESDIRDLYGTYLVLRNDFRGALEQQEYAVDADLHNAKRWQQIVALYGQLDDYDGAIAAGKRALEFVDDAPVLYLQLGAAYHQKKQFDEALRSYRKAASLVPETEPDMQSQVQCSIGDLFYSDNQPDSAFVYYEKAIAIDPENLLALNNFAYYLAENDRDLDRAERYSAICVRANPSNDTAIDTYAWIFYKKKDYEKAKEWIDRALDIEGDSAQADLLDHAGDIYFMNREVNEAVEFWKKALKANPDSKTLPKKIRQRTPFVE